MVQVVLAVLFVMELNFAETARTDPVNLSYVDWGCLIILSKFRDDLDACWWCHARGPCGMLAVISGNRHNARIAPVSS